jgi:predicted dehydrogenase
MGIRLEYGWIDLETAFAYTGQRMRVARRSGDIESVEERRLAFKDQFALEIDHFARCIREDRAPATPGEEGLRDQLLMDALYRSARVRTCSSCTFDSSKAIAVAICACSGGCCER